MRKNGIKEEELKRKISELQNYLEHAITQEIPVMPKMRKMSSLIQKMRKLNPNYNNQWWNYYGIDPPKPTPKRNLLKRAGLNPHVHTKIQLKKMTKAGLIRLVIKLEKFIVNHAYEMYKAKLPRLRTRSDPIFGDLKIPKSKRTMPISLREQIEYRKPRTKRKKLTGAAKAKFLARMNKGRRKKGLKPIRSR